jgi:hypothetical protein
MIGSMEVEEVRAVSAPVPIWSHRVRDSDWTAGYEDLVRAAGAFTRSLSFLSRHWSEIDPGTMGGLLRSLEATAFDVSKMLGGARYEDPSIDEALAARVASL